MGKRKSEGSTGHGGKEHAASLRTMLLRRKSRILKTQHARRAKRFAKEQHRRAAAARHEESAI